MHAAPILLLTLFAASVVAAPVPVSPTLPIEASEPLMVREAIEGATSPDLDNIKHQNLETLNAIIEARAISLGVKRRPVQLGTEVEEGNAKREPNRSSDNIGEATAKRGDNRLSNNIEEAAAKRGDNRLLGSSEEAAA